MPTRYTVSLEHDSELENPAEREQDWKLYSFCTRHCSFKDPELLGLSRKIGDDGYPVVRNPGIRAKLKAGLAHWLSYFEHGNALWFRAGSPVPAGVEFQWDGRRVAGLLIWEHDRSYMGAKTFEERAKDADGFLSQYTSWLNGEGYYFSIEDQLGDTIDSAGGFFTSEDMLEECASILAQHMVEFDVGGDDCDAAYLETELRRMVKLKQEQLCKT